jgi:hypothetical protein
VRLDGLAQVLAEAVVAQIPAPPANDRDLRWEQAGLLEVVRSPVAPKSTIVQGPGALRRS